MQIQTTVCPLEWLILKETSDNATNSEDVEQKEPPTGLVGIQTSHNHTESSLSLSQKIKHTFTKRLRKSVYHPHLQNENYVHINI